MVSLLQAIALGVVQGVTEWFPVSSSGHLVILQKLFGVSPPVVFDLFLHIGSLLVLVLVFWKDIKKLIKGLIDKDKYWIKFFWYLVIASIPIGLVGFTLNDYVKLAFNDLRIVGVSLLFTALLLFLSRLKRKKVSLNFSNVLIMGVFQALAILPGVSRSGATISSGMMVGVKREEVVRFAFLLFIPAIIGATLFELRNVTAVGNISVVLVGTLAAVIAGFASLKFLLYVIGKNKFGVFAWYCLALGLTILYYVL